MNALHVHQNVYLALDKIHRLVLFVILVTFYTKILVTIAVQPDTVRILIQMNASNALQNVYLALQNMIVILVEVVLIITFWKEQLVTITVQRDYMSMKKTMNA